MAEYRAKGGQMEVVLNLDTYANLPKALRVIAPEAKRQLLRDLRGVGMLIAGEARMRVLAIPVSDDGPNRALVAQSIKVRVSGLNVKVVAGGDKVPYPARALALLWELGGKAGRESWFHPAFGDKNDLVQQLSHNYLLSAALEMSPEVELAAQVAIERGIAACDAALTFGGHLG